MTRRTTLALVALSAAALSFAPALVAERKPLSPREKAQLTIGGKKIEIDYSAPSARGRTVFGGVVPFGQLWRTGANAATTLHTDADLELKGLAIPKGKYSLYSIPRQDGFTLVVNKQTGQWGTKHDPSKDLGRVELDVQQAPGPIETFSITLASAGDDKGLLTIAWGDRTASTQFTVR